MSGNGKSDPPKLNDQAPLFICHAVREGEQVKINLEEFMGSYVVLMFYPRDFTFVCPTEIISFSNKLSEFKQLGVTVIGVSTDSVYSHLAWIKTPRIEGGLEGTKMILAADINHKISTSYGVLDEESGAAQRALFILDGNHRIRYISVNDMSVGRNVDEVLRLIKAIQFTDEYGEVCPANWTPGSKGMAPTEAGVKEHVGKM